MSLHQLRHILLLFFISACTWLCAENEVEKLMAVKLKSGEKVIGTVIFQDSEVLVIRDLKGNRYQYPLSEIQTEALATEDELNPQKQEIIYPLPSVGLTLNLSGGVCVSQADEAGGFTDIDLLIGHRNIFGKNVFMGGGTGVHAIFLPEETLFSIPLLVRISLPLFSAKKNSLISGLDGGYAFAVGESLKAGFFAGFDIGWQFVTGKRTAINIGLIGKVQQYSRMVSEIIGEQDFSYTATRTMYNYGLKFGISF